MVHQGQAKYQQKGMAHKRPEQASTGTAPGHRFRGSVVLALEHRQPSPILLRLTRWRLDHPQFLATGHPVTPLYQAWHACELGCSRIHDPIIYALRQPTSREYVKRPTSSATVCPNLSLHGCWRGGSFLWLLQPQRFCCVYPKCCLFWTDMKCPHLWTWRCVLPERPIPRM